MDQQKTLDISHLPWQECGCGSILFVKAGISKKLPALLSPDGRQQDIVVEVLQCTACKKIPGFIFDTIPDLPIQYRGTNPFAEGDE